MLTEIGAQTKLVMAGPDGVDWQTQLEARVVQLDSSDSVRFPGMLNSKLTWDTRDDAEASMLQTPKEASVS